MINNWLTAATISLLQVTAPAFANDSYPAKNVTILVPFSAGSLVDTIARLYSEKLSQRLGRPVIVENRVGSGGITATQAMLLAPPDGYTLQMVSSSHAINQTLYPKLPYNTARDTTCIGTVGSSPTVVAIRSDLNINSLKDFIAYAKSKPNSLNYGSGGIGTAAHLAGQSFVKNTSTDIVHIPYKGVQEAVLETMANRIDLSFPPISIAKPPMESKKIVGLAVTSNQRSPMLPNTPTTKEAGLDMVYQIWYALIAHKKTPNSILEKLAHELTEVSKMPEIRQKLAAQGIDIMDATLGNCNTMIMKQIDELGVLVKSSGAKVE